MSSIAAITAALAAIPDGDLRDLPTILDGETVIVIVPELFAWLKAASSWEVDRRAGSHRELPGPRSAILEAGDVECSLVALAFLQATLRNIAGAADFIDATADALCAVEAAGPSRAVH